MGHERVGALPYTRKWREVVAQLAESSGSREDVAAIARATLQNVNVQFERIHWDDGVVAAFQFLVALTKSAPSEHPVTPSSSPSPKIDLDEGTSALKLVGQLRSWVESQAVSKEYAAIATRASADAISLWSAKHGKQANLFTGSVDSREVWRRADNGAGFCEVSRLFFSKFTERYLKYFLEREASASMTGVAERDRLAAQLREHIDGVSQFAFETSRITQSFAAGWFNNHARDKTPSSIDSRRFLSVAFAKMREELNREADADG
ncbi:MAG: hypothetical protein OXI56_04735 [bacterium]|nr:hypothetical protein [bacterium]MDE0601084.1 hypothetical protein [bacterium]